MLLCSPRKKTADLEKYNRLQGGWVSVEDDNGNDFLFVTVERDHGVVRVWRPNMVAKRVIEGGKTELTHEETMRLGLNEDASF